MNQRRLQMKYAILLSLSLFIISCNKNDLSLKRGIAWGMSMDQVSSQYKTNPVNKGSEFLDFKEDYYMSNDGHIEASYIYNFDSQNGLDSYKILVHAYSQEDNKALLEFANDKISEIGGAITEQEDNYIIDPAVGEGFVSERKIVFDKLYKSSKDEEVKVRLEYNKRLTGKDTTYDLTIACLAPGWTFKETPSSYRLKNEIKH